MRMVGSRYDGIRHLIFPVSESCERFHRIYCTGLGRGAPGGLEAVWVAGSLPSPSTAPLLPSSRLSHVAFYPPTLLWLVRTKILAFTCVS